MRKIISLFQRNYDGDRLVRDEVVPGAEWVIAGEGIATRKWDGTACMVRGGKLFKRYEVKAEKVKAGGKIPVGFEPAQPPDSVTGDQPGWVPVSEGPEDQWFRDAFKRYTDFSTVRDGAYEAIGPHFGGGHHDKNPEGCAVDVLAPHGGDELNGFPRHFERIKHYFETMGTHDPAIEGVVWHHPDGRMVKIKARDFGIRRPRRGDTAAT